MPAPPSSAAARLGAIAGSAAKRSRSTGCVPRSDHRTNIARAASPVARRIGYSGPLALPGVPSAVSA